MKSLCMAAAIAALSGCSVFTSALCAGAEHRINALEPCDRADGCALLSFQQRQLDRDRAFVAAACGDEEEDLDR